MPNVTIKVPLSSSPLTFATRARRRAGLGMFLAPAATSNFPAGPHFSRGGLGGFFSKAPATPLITRVGGPIVCPRGLESFFLKRVNVRLPSHSIFTPYLQGEHSSGGLRGFGRSFRRRRGLGQDDSGDYTNPIVGWDAALTSGLSTPAPTFTSSDLDLQLGAYGPTPSIASEPIVSSISPLSNIVTLPASEGGGTVNLAEAQAALANPTLSPAQTLLGAGYTAAQIAKLTLAQQTAAASALPSVVSAPSSITSVLNQYGSYILLGGVGIVALALISGKKGRR